MSLVRMGRSLGLTRNEYPGLGWQGNLRCNRFKPLRFWFRFQKKPKPSDSFCCSYEMFRFCK